MNRLRCVAIACVLWFAASAVAWAEARSGDPLAYDLRMALAPVAFQAGVSQSWLGSAARIEYGITHYLDVGVRGNLAWKNVIGERPTRSYSLALDFAYHFAQEVEDESLSGTVYPEDPPALQSGVAGTDRDLMDLPVSDRLQSGSLAPPDRNRQLMAAMRTLQSLRFGVAYSQVVERALPNGAQSAQNRLPLLHIGYGWGTHWNLPASLTGKREIGYRRLYVDALLTAPGLTHTTPMRTNTGMPLDFFPLGVRIGLEGAMDGLLSAAPGVGFGYGLELGALPGRGGLEGYLLIALGVSLDVATR
jgi:hypothetical protein